MRAQMTKRVLTAAVWLFALSGVHFSDYQLSFPSAKADFLGDYHTVTLNQNTGVPLGAGMNLPNTGGQNTVRSNVTIFSWDPVDNINGLQGVQGTVPIPMAKQRAESSWRQFYPATIGGDRGYHLMRPPEQVAAEIAPVLSNLPPGQQLVLLRGFGEACDISELRPANSPECMLIGARNFNDLIGSLYYNIHKTYTDYDNHHMVWLTSFFTELKRLAPDVVPTILLEYEKGINYWQIKQMYDLADMTDDQRAARIEQMFEWIFMTFGAGFPEELQPYEASDLGEYWNRPRGRAAVSAWNKFTGNLRSETLRYHVQTAFERVYGKNAPFRMMNYGDALITNTALRDHNGWPAAGAPAMITGTHSSPSYYLNPGSRHGTLTGNINFDLLYADALASFHDMLLNHNGDASKIVPWVAINSVRGEFWPNAALYAAMHRNLIEHLYERGVRTFLLFEPYRAYQDKTPEELAFMRENITGLIDFLHTHSADDLAAQEALAQQNPGTEGDNAQDDTGGDEISIPRIPPVAQDANQGGTSKDTTPPATKGMMNDADLALVLVSIRNAQSLDDLGTLRTKLQGVSAKLNGRQSLALKTALREQEKSLRAKEQAAASKLKTDKAA